MTLTEHHEPRAPRTFAQTLAAVLRHVSDNLDGGPTVAPALADLKSRQLYDAQVALLGAAADRNFERWPVLGAYVWPNRFVGATYAEEVTFLKDWVETRLAWIDDKGKVEIDYRPVHTYTLTNEIAYIEPKARVY